MANNKNKTVILNASEGSMDSSAKAIRMTQESGRSMVEMLGTLAVIGVLSIAGIAGYTTAMNKYKANEILNGASVRAMVVSGQLQSGSTTPALAEFGVSDFATTVYKADGSTTWASGENQFAITTSNNIDQDVCKQIVDNKGSEGSIRKILSGTTDLTDASKCPATATKMAFVYNNDLTTTDPAPTGTPGNECTTTCTSTVSTDEVKCKHGYCECTEGIWQPSGTGTGSCKTSITDGDCTKNADCVGKTVGGVPCTSSTCYCAITTTSYAGKCETPEVGTCSNIMDATEKTYNGKTFLLSKTNRSMTWWTARNWCLAHNKTLASLSDLDCNRNDCSDWDTLTSDIGSSMMWLNDSDGACRAYMLATYYGYLYRQNRNSQTFTLCK